MKKRVAIIVASVCAVVALQGCAVGLASSGKKEPDLSTFRVGSTREEVERQLGSPVSSLTSPDGKRTDIYEYEVGNEPSRSRAARNAALDALTLGAWEAFAIPSEFLRGEKRHMSILYGPDDRVSAITSLPGSPQTVPEKRASPEGKE